MKNTLLLAKRWQKSQKNVIITTTPGVDFSYIFSRGILKNNFPHAVEFDFAAEKQLRKIGSLLAPNWLPIGSQLAPDWLPIGSQLAPDWLPIGRNFAYGENYPKLEILN
jgi:hypothetical protein